MTDETETTETADGTRSLRDDLEATWDQLTAEAEREELEATTSDDTVDPDDAEGGFAEDEDGEPDPTEAAGDNGYLPLEHWPAAWRARFEALSDDAKPYVLELHKSLEQAHSERTQTLAEREKALGEMDAIDAALAPYRETMRSNGISEPEAIGKLLEAHAWLQSDPQAGLAYLAHAYGMEPTAAGEAPPAMTPAAPPAADLAAQAELVSALDQHAAEQHEMRLLAAMEAQLAARARATNEAGEPRFPHFDAVRPRLAAMLRAGTAGSFEDAYEQAVWADPILRDEALKARDAKMAEERESARKAELRKAKKAGRAAIRGSEPAVTGLPPARSHREELERVWDQLVNE